MNNMQLQHKLIRVCLLAFGLLLSSLTHAEYLLGPGDLVRITVYGNPDLSNETRVTQEGKLTFPLLGEVPVGGSSIAQSEKKIATMLAEGGFLKNAQVNIVVMQFASQQISVLGNVLKPGRYPLEQRTSSLVEMLAVAGGINQAGADTVTVITYRNGELARHEIDVDAMFRGGDAFSNLPLAAGDMIYVPRAPVFYAYGEVQRPGAFRLEREMTVAQALATGGGLTARGTERGLRIKRRAGGALETIEVGLGDTLNTGDVLLVRESLF